MSAEIPRRPHMPEKPLMPKDTAEPAAQSTTITPDFCIIGAGAGGTALAVMAAAFGQRVVLVEKHKMGGDSLNYGSVPSKALLSAAKHANAMRTATPFGINGVEPLIDHAAVRAHVRDVIEQIAPNSATERLAGLGVRVIAATGKFVGRSTLVAGEYRIEARWFVVATGSSPIIPRISGLSEVAYFTNETIFDAARLLPHLIIIGEDARGLELAQAHRRLGSRVTVIAKGQVLKDEDPELAAVVLSRLWNEGIDIREGLQIRHVSGEQGRITVETESQKGSETIAGTDLLLAAGRRANVADLGLEAAGVKFNSSGVRVNRKLQTTNGRVYAIGDVTGGDCSTHVAKKHAEIVLKKSLFRFAAKAGAQPPLRVLFTDPELATVGLSETEATSKYGKINVLRWPYHVNDRAVAEREIDGHVKVITSKGGMILGAGIAGARADEMIQLWALAISQGLDVRAMSQWSPAYPTFTEINRDTAFRQFATAPSNPYLRKVIALMAKLG